RRGPSAPGGPAQPPDPSLAFEPIGPPARPISRQPSPATEPAVGWRSIGNRGGGPCTYKRGSDDEFGSPTAKWAWRCWHSTIFAASGSPGSRLRARAKDLPRQQVHLLGRISHGRPSL